MTFILDDTQSSVIVAIYMFPLGLRIVAEAKLYKIAVKCVNYHSWQKEFYHKSPRNYHKSLEIG